VHPRVSRTVNPRRNKKLKTDDEEATEAAAAAEEAPATTPEATKKAKDKAAAVTKPGVSMGEITGEEAAKEKEEFNKEKELSKGINWWDHETRDKAFDPLKPYRTPWRPRYYLSAFAFIPKYLEVNHNIGHAVYLRDPVASPGLSEVPTPFHGETLQLAYNWFLRRR